MASLKSLTKHPILTLLETQTSLRSLQQIHTQLLVHALLHDPLSLNHLITTLSLHHNSPQSLLYSHHLLSHSLLSKPTLFSFNTLIRAFSKSPYPHHSLHHHNLILRYSLSPDNYTFNFLIRACAQLGMLCIGSSAHAAAMKRGFASDPHVRSGLIRMYAESGSTEASKRVYDDIESPDVVMMTAMVCGLAEAGDVDSACGLFERMPDRDVVAWNAMIAGYNRVGRPREALGVFDRMRSDGISVNESTLGSVLSACSRLGALDRGEWVHGFIKRGGLGLSVALGTALIDMYSKCGHVDRVMEVFDLMREKNVFTWNAVIGGLSMNGASVACLELFHSMLEHGVEPNEVTFISVLRGCAVAGMVDWGVEIFESMRWVHRIEPTLEHYGCMVDLYGRAGQLEEAVDFIRSMPIEPHVGVWGALLNACRLHRNKALGELALSKIVEIESGNDGAYVTLSNIYAENKNWGKVSSVRKLMKSKGVKKEPGFSVIEVGGEVHEFFVGDKGHPDYSEIESMLAEISRRLRFAGYVSKTEQVMFDVEEEEKESSLRMHSEKLAIAFGLIKLEEGVTIRIVKNIRVCTDCHEVTKLISKLFGRVIVMRDRNRFHHFRDGACSCMDYW